MANRTSRHLDIFSWSSAHSSCMYFVDFGYCMDPLTYIADDFLLEISPRCSVINRDLPWKQSELYYFNLSSNSIEYFIANNRILQLTSRNTVTSLFSLATTDIDLARLGHSTYPSALVSACEMMNWPNNFLIWSSTSTLAFSIGTLQRNAAQLWCSARENPPKNQPFSFG